MLTRCMKFAVTHTVTAIHTKLRPHTQHYGHTHAKLCSHTTLRTHTKLWSHTNKHKITVTNTYTHAHTHIHTHTHNNGHIQTNEHVQNHSPHSLVPMRLWARSIVARAKKMSELWKSSSLHIVFGACMSLSGPATHTSGIGAMTEGQQI